MDPSFFLGEVYRYSRKFQLGVRYNVETQKVLAVKGTTDVNNGEGNALLAETRGNTRNNSANPQ